MRRSRLSIELVLLVFAFAILPAAARAQNGSIRGRVADSTGAPIGQALVVADPGGYRATSRDNGDYVISRVPAGTYTVRVRRIGFATPAVAVTVPEGQVVERNFVAVHAAVSLAEVVIGSRGYNGRYVYTRVEVTGR